jgi:hypothetical protein
LKRAAAVAMFLGLGSASLAAHATMPLVPSNDDVGFSLDEDWQENWRRVLDRHGREDPVGPIQQRFSGDHRPETEEAQAVSDYALGDEWKWAKSERGARWWVHSYDALRLGTHVQMKYGAAISDTWRVRMRFDRLNTPSTASDFVQGDFRWAPSPDEGVYTSISFYPRIEKQDYDFAFTVGYRHAGELDGRLKLYVLDTFSNASYALAKSTDFDTADAVVTRQSSLPLALAFELSGLRVGNLRFEAYLGRVLPQTREVYSDAFERVREQKESATLLGAFAEYRVPSAPLWAGVSGTFFLTRWRDFDPDAIQIVSVERNVTSYAPVARSVDERTYQGRAYALAVFNPNLRLETQLRYTSRPEYRSGFANPTGQWCTRRRDSEWIYHTRVQWLMSRRAGLDLSHWRTFREAAGAPEANVVGRAARIDVRVLLRYERFLATFGVGINPLSGERPRYAGGGGNMVWLFD